MTYGHLQADCLYTGISSGLNARCRVWEAFTSTFLNVQKYNSVILVVSSIVTMSANVCLERTAPKKIYYNVTTHYRVSRDNTNMLGKRHLSVVVLGH